MNEKLLRRLVRSTARLALNALSVLAEERAGMPSRESATHREVSILFRGGGPKLRRQVDRMILELRHDAATHWPAEFDSLPSCYPGTHHRHVHRVRGRKAAVGEVFGDEDAGGHQDARGLGRQPAGRRHGAGAMNWLTYWWRCRTARGRWLLRQLDVETAFHAIAARTLPFGGVAQFVIEVSRFTCTRRAWRNGEEWSDTAQNPGRWVVRYLRQAGEEQRDERRYS